MRTTANGPVRVIYTLSALGRQLYSANAIRARRFAVWSRPEAFYRPQDLAKLAASNTSCRREVPHLIKVRLHAIPPSKDGRHLASLIPASRQAPSSLYHSETEPSADLTAPAGPSPVSLAWDTEPAEALSYSSTEPFEAPYSIRYPLSRQQPSQQRITHAYDPLYLNSSNRQNERRVTRQDQSTLSSSPAPPVDSARKDTTATPPPQHLDEKEESASVLELEGLSEDVVNDPHNDETHEEHVDKPFTLLGNKAQTPKSQRPADESAPTKLEARMPESHRYNADAFRDPLLKLQEIVESAQSTAEPTNESIIKKIGADTAEFEVPKPWWRRRAEKVASRKEQREQAHRFNREAADNRRRARLRAVGLLPPLEGGEKEKNSERKITPRNVVEKKDFEMKDAPKLEAEVVKPEAKPENEVGFERRAMPKLEAELERKA